MNEFTEGNFNNCMIHFLIFEISCIEYFDPLHFSADHVGCRLRSLTAIFFYSLARMNRLSC
jgi:hypothetical protein